MSQRARLEKFLVDAFSSGKELRRWALGLHNGAKLTPAIAWDNALEEVAHDLSVELEKRREINPELFVALRDIRPNRAHEIAEIEVAADPEPMHKAWRRLLIEQFTRRQILPRVRDTGVEIDRVYVDISLRLQIPNTSASPSPCGAERSADHEGQLKEEVHGTGVFEQAFDLDAWLTGAHPDPLPLILEGEVGSGKTERLVRAVVALARRGECERTTPLPLWLDAKLLGAGPISRCLAQGIAWSETQCRELVEDREARFAVFVDSLDEVGLSVHAAIEDLRAALGTRLHRLVLAMRPIRRRAFRSVRVARIAPWTAEQSATFFNKNREIDAEAIARIEAEALPPDIRANPLTATFTLLVAKEEPNALGNRTRLFRVIVDRMVAEWQRQRDVSSGRRPWRDLAPLLAQLALERLRDYPDGFSEAFLRERLDAWFDEGSEELLNVLTAQYGVFVWTGQRYDFALRWLAEHLAARAFGADLDKVVEAARRPWGFEAARHAISGITLRSVDQGIRLMTALLRDEVRDARLDRPLHLRRVLLMIAAAADLRTAFPAAIVGPLVNAVCRRLYGETSYWIGTEVATAVRAVARAGGPAWEAILARILPVMRDFAAHGEDAAIDGWLALLRHRSKEARVFAVEQLAASVDDPRVRQDLFALLMDHDRAPSPAFAAGKALRRASRDGGFAARIDELRRILQNAPQIPLGAVALALRPGEAPPRDLAHGLLCAANAGEDVTQARTELQRDPNGTAALDRESPGWRKGKQELNHIRMSGPRPRVSDYVRWDLVRCIAPALHTLPAPMIAEIVATGDQSHALSHELTNLQLEAAPAVVHAVIRKRFCDHRMDDLTTLVTRCPEVGEILLARWTEIVADGRAEHECIQFPGQALAPLVAQGSEEAVEAVVAWLPRSELGQPHWVWSGPVMPRAAFEHPCVAAVACGCLRQGKLDGGMRAKVNQRLSAAWDDATWGGLLGALDPMAPNCLRSWPRVSSLCAYAEIPEKYTQRLVASARALLGAHVDGCGWHEAGLAALRMLDKHRLTAHVTAELRALVGLGEMCRCSYLWTLAAALVMPVLVEAEQRTLSSRLAAAFSEGLHLLKKMPAAALEAIVRPAPEVWMEQLAAPNASLITTSALSDPSEVNWRLLRALPPRVSGPYALKLLQSEACPSLPWIELKEPGFRRRMRPSDLMWHLAFEGGIEADFTEFLVPDQLRSAVTGPTAERPSPADRITPPRLTPMPSSLWNPAIPPDIAILIALPEEFEALADEYAHEWTAVPNPNYIGSDFYFIGPNGYRCAATIMPRMGPTPASNASQRLLAMHPGTIINIGIAGGFKKGDLCIGDVIVPRQIDAYDETGKYADIGWQRRGSDYRPSPELIAEAQQLKFTARADYDRWATTGAAQLRALGDGPDGTRIDRLLAAGLLRPSPVVSTNNLASGSFVVASKLFAEFLRDANADIHAGEMEAAGMMAAAEYQRARVHTLVVRGISDHVDADKSEVDAIGKGALRRLAMANAWRLVHTLMTLGLLPRTDALTVNQPSPHPPPAQNSAPFSQALRNWQEKLAFMLAQEPTTYDHNAKYSLQKSIEEARAKIRELGGLT